MKRFIVFGHVLIIYQAFSFNGNLFLEGIKRGYLK